MHSESLRIGHRGLHINEKRYSYSNNKYCTVSLRTWKGLSRLGTAIFASAADRLKLFTNFLSPSTTSSMWTRCSLLRLKQYKTNSNTVIKMLGAYENNEESSLHFNFFLGTHRVAEAPYGFGPTWFANLYLFDDTIIAGVFEIRHDCAKYVLFWILIKFVEWIVDVCHILLVKIVFFSLWYTEWMNDVVLLWFY